MITLLIWLGGGSRLSGQKIRNSKKRNKKVNCGGRYLYSRLASNSLVVVGMAVRAVVWDHRFFFPFAFQGLNCGGEVDLTSPPGGWRDRITFLLVLYVLLLRRVLSAIPKSHNCLSHDVSCSTCRRSLVFLSQFCPSRRSGPRHR